MNSAAIVETAGQEAVAGNGQGPRLRTHAKWFNDLKRRTRPKPPPAPPPDPGKRELAEQTRR
jgi:hypothetical protein